MRAGNRNFVIEEETGRAVSPSYSYIIASIPFVNLFSVGLTADVPRSIGGVLNVKNNNIYVSSEALTNNIVFSPNNAGNVKVQATNHSLSKGNIIHITDSSLNYQGSFLVHDVLDKDTFLPKNLDGSPVAYTSPGNASASVKRETLFLLGEPGVYQLFWNFLAATDTDEFVYEFFIIHTTGENGNIVTSPSVKEKIAQNLNPECAGLSFPIQTTRKGACVFLMVKSPVDCNFVMRQSHVSIIGPM